MKTDFNAQKTGKHPEQTTAQAEAAGTKPVFSWSVRVYYEDTDTGGIVYYANYLRFFERARTEWLRSLGVSQQALFDSEGLQFVVRSIDLQYLAPARLDDMLHLKMDLLAARRASLVLNQTASLEGQSETLVSAKVRIAAINHVTGRPIGLPQWILDRVNR
ncbi:MAG: tol-pal system-associated acyl-CoA thioesterase [Burkholderiaceae bacterium]